MPVVTTEKQIVLKEFAPRRATTWKNEGWRQVHDAGGQGWFIPGLPL